MNTTSSEWPHLVEIFGVDQLARLLAISPSSVRRYKEHARTIPDDIGEIRGKHCLLQYLYINIAQGFFG